MSPKSQFLLDTVRVKKHVDLCQHPELHEALLAAFSELCWQLPGSENPNTSWAANARREGAKQFIDIFLGLGTQHVPKKPTPAGLLESEDGNSSSTNTRGTGSGKPKQ